MTSINQKYIRKVKSNEGKDLLMITLRVLPETRDYLNEQAKKYDVSVNEYIKQKLGIQTVRLINKENGSKTDSIIETIYEI